MDLIIHLEKPPEDRDTARDVEEAVHHYFAYRARLNRMEFKRLMKQGRMSLTVGLAFLAVCFGGIELFAHKGSGPFYKFAAEGLTIAGWVAMWKPMEIYLYDWWPLRRRGQIFEKLSRVPVELRGPRRTPSV